MKAHPGLHPSAPARAHGFTLIELLTVIAIIGILAAIIIPTVARVRQTASKAAMTSNLRQVGAATLTFVADNKDSLPGAWKQDGNYALAGGHNAYIPPWPNANHLGSDVQLGKYLASSRVVIDGVNRVYCPMLESPRFATMRQPGTYPTSVLAGTNVITFDGANVKPFGNKTPFQFSLRYAQLNGLFSLSRRWMLIEIDQTTPKAVDANLSGAGWFNELPKEPVHGAGWVTLFFDAHVEMLGLNDPRLNNRIN